MLARVVAVASCVRLLTSGWAVRHVVRLRCERPDSADIWFRGIIIDIFVHVVSTGETKFEQYRSRTDCFFARHRDAEDTVEIFLIVTAVRVSESNARTLEDREIQVR